MEAEQTGPPVVATKPEAKPMVRKAAAPKWETDAKERLRAGLRRFSKPLSDLVGRDANEGDTRLLVTDFLCEALGYDKYSDLTTEYLVRGEFADYGIRIDKQLVAFIEVKRATTRLDAKHLRQVEMYSVNEGVEWAILTNGSDWRVYHLAGGPPKPVAIDLALDVNILGDESPQHKVNQLFYLSRESMRRHQIDDLWKARAATSPKSLAGVMLSPSVVQAIQKELKKQTGHSIDAVDLGRVLRETVLRPECFAK